MIAGCGTTASKPSSPPPSTSPTPTAASAPSGPGTYPRADALLSALDARGAPCTAVSYVNGGTVGGSLNPYIDCTGISEGDTSIVVFTSHAAALAFAQTQLGVTNLGPVGEVVGVNWVVNTMPAYGRKVAATLGGKLLISQAAEKYQRAARARAKKHAAAEARRKAAARARARLRNTVEFIVTGSSADVTYGPSGSNFQGSVPLDTSEHIPASPPIYYAITAQLNGGGTVSCAIKIGGRIISSGTATGSYNIAMFEAVQDPINGGWQDANSG
jgi:hypothetical protein